MLFIVLLLWTNTLISWAGVVSNVGLFNVVANFLFMQDAFPVSSSSFGINGALWTLTIEMSFYLVLPFFVHLFLGRRWIAGMAITLIVSVVYLYLVRYSLQPVVDVYTASVAQYGVTQSAIRGFLSHQFLGYLPEFGLGMSLANFWAFRDQRPQVRWSQILRSEPACFATTVLGLGVLAFAVYHVLDMGTSNFFYLSDSMLAALGTGLLILGSQSQGGLLRRAYAFMPLRFFGIIGYSVFLWHFPLITNAENYPIFTDVTSFHRFVVMVLLILPLVTLLGSILFLLVEKPFIENRKPLVVSAPGLAGGMVEPPPRPLDQSVRPPTPPQYIRPGIPVDELPTMPRPAMSELPTMAQPAMSELPTLKRPAILRSRVSLDRRQSQADRDMRSQ